MDDCEVLRVLAAADAAPALPRLGGMARPDGVAIVSEDVWCFSRTAGGPLDVRSMPRPRLARLPFLRGLVKLAAAITPLFGRGSTARPRERLLLLAAIALPFPLYAVPRLYANVLVAVVTAALVAWMLRGATLRLHGAEHRAIAAAEQRLLVATWHGVERPTRFSVRCGTNLTVLLAGTTYAVDRFWMLPATALTPLLVMLVSLMITMEFWIVAQRWPAHLGRVAVVPGLLLQRLTTREPTLDQTRVALRAAAAVLSATG